MVSPSWCWICSTIKASWNLWELRHMLQWMQQERWIWQQRQRHRRHDFRDWPLHRTNRGCVNSCNLVTRSSIKIVSSDSCIQDQSLIIHTVFWARRSYDVSRNNLSQCPEPTQQQETIRSNLKTSAHQNEDLRPRFHVWVALPKSTSSMTNIDCTLWNEQSGATQHATQHRQNNHVSNVAATLSALIRAHLPEISYVCNHQCQLVGKEERKVTPGRTTGRMRSHSAEMLTSKDMFHAISGDMRLCKPQFSREQTRMRHTTPREDDTRIEHARIMLLKQECYDWRKPCSRSVSRCESTARTGNWSRQQI